MQRIFKHQIITNTSFRTSISLRLQHNMSTFTSNRRNFGTIITVTRVQETSDRSPFTTFVNTPTRRHTTAINTSITIRHTRQNINQRMHRTTTMLPIVISITNGHRAHTLFITMTMVIVKRFHFRNRITNAPLSTRTLHTVTPNTFLRVTDNMANANRRTPIFISQQTMRRTFSPRVLTPNSHTNITITTTVAFTTMTLRTRFNRIVRFALALRALSLAIIQMAHNGIINRRIRLPPFLRFRYNIHLHRFRTGITQRRTLNFLRLRFNTTQRPTHRQRIDLHRARANVTQHLVSRNLRTLFANQRVDTMNPNLHNRLLHIRPFVIKIANQRALRFSTQLLQFHRILNSTTYLIDIITFRRHMVRHNTIFRTVTSINVQHCRRLTVRINNSFQLALIRMKQDRPARNMNQGLRTFNLRFLVFTSSFDTTHSNLRHTRTISTPTHSILTNT